MNNKDYKDEQSEEKFSYIDLGNAYKKLGEEPVIYGADEEEDFEEDEEDIKAIIDNIKSHIDTGAGSSSLTEDEALRIMVGNVKKVSNSIPNSEDYLAFLKVVNLVKSMYSCFNEMSIKELIDELEKKHSENRLYTIDKLIEALNSL